MEKTFFENRVGCHPLKFPVVFAKQLLPGLVPIAVAWAYGRKITFERANAKAAALSVLLLCNQFSSSKAPALYRFQMQQVQKESWKQYGTSLIISSFHRLLMGYLLRVLFRITLNQSWNILAQQAACQLLVPAYLCWHDPAKDGKFANYVPLDNEEKTELTSRIFEYLEGRKANDTEKKQVASTISDRPHTIFAELMKACGWGDLRFENQLRIIKSSGFSQLKNKGLVADARLIHEHFIEGRTLGARAFEVFYCWIDTLW